MGAALAVALLAAACGGGSSDDGSGIATLDDEAAAVAPSNGDASTGTSAATAGAAEADPELAFAEWEACMADHGVEIFTGETVDGGGLVVQDFDESEGDPQTQAGALAIDDLGFEDFEAAQEACEHHLDGLDQGFDLSPEQQAAMDDAMLEFQNCMKDRGIDLPDVTSDGGFAIQFESEVDPQNGGGGLDDTAFEDFEAAAAECDHVFAQIEAELGTEQGS